MSVRFADSFCGLGGWTHGAKQAGGELVWAANHWGPACEWHEKNHPEEVPVCQDLMHFDWTRLPELDLFLASPSCKGLTQTAQPARKGTGGSHAPNSDAILAKHGAHRNTAWAVISAAEARRPAALVIENVPDLLRWELYPVWRVALETLGYHVTDHVLCAADYGSAQERYRAVIVASQRHPIHLLPKIAERGTIAGDILLPDDDPSNRWSTIESKSERMRVRMRKAQNEAGARCVWNNVSEASGRPMGGLLPTLTTKSGSQLYLLDGERCKILGPREIARGQSFPDSTLIPSKRELASELIGNAIDCKLSTGVAEQVVAAL